MTRPRILVTLDTGVTQRRGVPFPSVHQKAAYGKAVLHGGGTPLWVAPGDDPHVDALARLADGLVVTGGDFDLPPSIYGAEPNGRRVDPPKPARTHFEAKLTEAALSHRLPVLAVCGGMQLLAVVLGGSLLVDIHSDRPGSLDHEQPNSPAEPGHPVTLAGWLRTQHGPRAEVNSTHHQAVDRCPSTLEPWAFAPDGILEAAGDAHRGLFAVQWHPELLADRLCGVVYGAFIEACRARAAHR